MNAEIVDELVNKLCGKNNIEAGQALKLLEIESEQSDTVYQYMDKFIEMIDSNNSYIRTRGLVLIAVNARWDMDNKVDEIIDIYLEHILDEKPITSRQCIKVLPVIAKYKSDLVKIIQNALMKADTEIYADSMQPLIYKDIVEALKKIKK